MHNRKNRHQARSLDLNSEPEWRIWTKTDARLVWHTLLVSSVLVSDARNTTPWCSYMSVW